MISNLSFAAVPPYIPSPKGRGFTAVLIKFMIQTRSRRLYISIPSLIWNNINFTPRSEFVNNVKDYGASSAVFFGDGLKRFIPYGILQLWAEF
jgi:hypothetical protein